MGKKKKCKKFILSVVIYILIQAVTNSYALTPVDNQDQFRVSNESFEEYVGEYAYSKSNNSIAIDKDGNFVIAWLTTKETPFGKPKPPPSIYFKKYKSDGKTLIKDNTIVANTFVNVIEAFPKVAMNDNGEFIIGWKTDSTTYKVKRYNPDGTDKSDFTFTDTDKVYDIAIDNDGGFGILYVTDGIYVKRYNKDNTLIASILVFKNTTSFSIGNYRAMAMDKVDGSFVVTYEGLTSGWKSKIYAQGYKYNAAKDNIIADPAVNSGNRFEVDDSAFASGIKLKIKMDESKNIIFGWIGYNGTKYVLYGKRFNADGTPRDPIGKFGVNLNTDLKFSAWSFDIGINSPGIFSFVWSSCSGTATITCDIYGQSYLSGITNQEPKDVKLNTTGTNAFSPSIVIDEKGNAMISWVEYNSYWGYKSEVFARRFNNITIPFIDLL